MISRRLLLVQTLLVLAGCVYFNSTSDRKLEKLTIGIVAYGEASRKIEQYNQFVNYLQKEINTLIDLEPTYNEIKAIEQIQRQAWDLVFAPSGLAAIAIAKAQYLPLFRLQNDNQLRSVFVVLKQSRIQKLEDLAKQKVALGQPGSSTGYYVPLYDLYGYTLAEVLLAPTPQTVLEWISKGDVAAGALSESEFNLYRSQFSSAEFRVIYTSRPIPVGSVLISPKLERNQQELIKKAMSSVSSDLAENTGYIPNAKVPDYQNLIAMIEKVKPMEAHINEKPARLF